MPINLHFQSCHDLILHDATRIQDQACKISGAKVKFVDPFHAFNKVVGFCTEVDSCFI